jgi:ParB/RepB/Spo0J family partition protein
MTTELASNEPVGGHVPLMELDFTQIYVDESRNLRRFAPDAKSIEELAADIVDNGQLQPVIVRASANGLAHNTPYSLVAGFRRMRALDHAIKSLGYDKPVLARVIEADDTQSSVSNLAENMRRKELSPMDVSFAISELKKIGMLQKDIGKKFGKSQGWVAQVSTLVNLRPDIQRKIHTGDIPFTVARTLAAMTDEEQDKALEAVATAKAAGESASEAGKKASAASGKPKSGRGRKSKADKEDAGKVGLSAKKVSAAFEERVAEITAKVETPEGKVEPKLTKADEKVVGIYKLMLKFMGGGIGGQALENKLRAIL